MACAGRLPAPNRVLRGPGQVKGVLVAAPQIELNSTAHTANPIKPDVSDATNRRGLNLSAQER